jgi:hypothetical protein
MVNHPTVMPSRQLEVCASRTPNLQHPGPAQEIVQIMGMPVQVSLFLVRLAGDRKIACF